MHSCYNVWYFHFYGHHTFASVYIDNLTEFYMATMGHTKYNIHSSNQSTRAMAEQKDPLGLWIKWGWEYV